MNFIGTLQKSRFWRVKVYAQIIPLQVPRASQSHRRFLNDRQGQGCRTQYVSGFLGGSRDLVSSCMIDFVQNLITPIRVPFRVLVTPFMTDLLFQVGLRAQGLGVGVRVVVFA